MLRLRRSRNDDHLAALREAIGPVELPTFPRVVLATIDAIRDPEASATSIARPLSADPRLTVRLLKLVNSPAFGPSRPITSVEQAVAMAGMANVESIVLAVGVNVVVPRQPVEGLDHARYWWAASRRAALARAFAFELDPTRAGLSFTAGLLLDMALPFLAVARHDYRPLLTEWHGGGDDLHDLEASEYGWTHADVARWLCAEWGLPAELTSAIADHHRPSAPPAVRLAAPWREHHVDEVHERVVSQASEEFGLAADQVVALIESANASAADLAQLLG
ncbi:MAG: HDOD domain-containing protein [Acidimicrobiales bacterium]